MALPNPRGLAIANFLLERLQRISTADGYFTDAGVTAELGPAKQPELEFQVTVQVGQESPQQKDNGADSANPQVSDSYLMQRQLVIIGQIKSDPTNDPKGLRLEYLLSDIKRAVFDGKPFDPAQRLALGWPVYTGATLVQRPDGNEYESVNVTGTVTYLEAIGDPANG